MLNRLIDFSLRHRAAVILATLVFAVAGGLSLRQLDIDAFPDTTPVQVQINTTAPALSSEEVERQITFPVEQAISGLPGLRVMRSISKFGLSQVVVLFEDDIDIYFARQLINERLSTVQLPAGIERPQMGPVSTGLGEVFHYVLTYDGVDVSQLSHPERVDRLTELRTVHDWVVKPQLRSVPGVAEVNSWGGYEKQYQVRLIPDALIKHSLTYEQVAEAIAANNQNVGGGTITDGGELLLVHGVGRTVNVDQIANIVIKAEDGVPIRVSDVAGCTDQETAATAVADEHADAEHGPHDGHADGAHQHGEWWCGEHGVPEEECPLCDKSLVAEFKAKGDWCEDHNRPDSQCFICTPENFEKYAALYEAKYGERPAMPTE